MKSKLIYISIGSLNIFDISIRLGDRKGLLWLPRKYRLFKINFYDTKLRCKFLIGCVTQTYIRGKLLITFHHYAHNKVVLTVLWNHDPSSFVVCRFLFKVNFLYNEGLNFIFCIIILCTYFIIILSKLYNQGLRWSQWGEISIY